MSKKLKYVDPRNGNVCTFFVSGRCHALLKVLLRARFDAAHFTPTTLTGAIKLMEEYAFEAYRVGDEDIEYLIDRLGTYRFILDAIKPLKQFDRDHPMNERTHIYLMEN